MSEPSCYELVSSALPTEDIPFCYALSNDALYSVTFDGRLIPLPILETLPERIYSNSPEAALLANVDTDLSHFIKSCASADVDWVIQLPLEDLIKRKRAARTRYFGSPAASLPTGVLTDITPLYRDVL